MQSRYIGTARTETAHMRPEQQEKDGAQQRGEAYSFPSSCLDHGESYVGGRFEMDRLDLKPLLTTLALVASSSWSKVETNFKLDVIIYS
jgi:hypothetical protein